MNTKWILVCLLLVGPAVHGQVDVVLHEDQTFDLRAEDVVLADVLEKIGSVSGSTLTAPAVLTQQKVNLDLHNATLEEIVEELAGSYALVYERDADGNFRLTTARLTSQEELAEQDLRWRERRQIERNKKIVKDVSDQIKKLYGYAGVLNYDDAKALVESRRQQTEILVEKLAAMGPGGARAILAQFGEITDPRAQEAMLQALGKIDDPAASVVLGALFQNLELPFSFRDEAVVALSHRQDADALKTLQGILAQETDPRLLVTAIKAMAGRTGALESLAGLIQTEDQKKLVKAEAIRSVGEMGGKDALDVLMKTAMSSGDSSLRTIAIQEIGRSFGVDAVPALQPLLSDPDENVRINAIRGIGRVKSPEAELLLTKVSKEDSSESVRQWAQSFLMPTSSPTAIP